MSLGAETNLNSYYCSRGCYAMVGELGDVRNRVMNHVSLECIRLTAGLRTGGIAPWASAAPDHTAEAPWAPGGLLHLIP